MKHVLFFLHVPSFILIYSLSDFEMATCNFSSISRHSWAQHGNQEALRSGLSCSPLDFTYHFYYLIYVADTESFPLDLIDSDCIYSKTVIKGSHKRAHCQRLYFGGLCCRCHLHYQAISPYFIWTGMGWLMRAKGRPHPTTNKCEADCDREQTWLKGVFFFFFFRPSCPEVKQCHLLHTSHVFAVELVSAVWNVNSLYIICTVSRA